MTMNLSPNNLKQFHHIIDEKPSLCISGHKVKHFTYLFDTVEYTILKIGTSYCKKHGLLKQGIKNEILITVLREFIEFEQNKQNLSKLIFESVDLLIGKKIQYFQNLELTSDSIKYYDYKLPLEHLKRDILELGTVYFTEKIENYKLVVERITDLLEIAEIVELKIPLENVEINDESKEIDETLTNIREDILKLLNYEDTTNNEKIINNYSEGCVLDNIINNTNNTNNIIDILFEKEIEENIEIEETIKTEILEYSERIEEFEKSEDSEEKYIEATISDFYKNIEESKINENIMKEVINEIINEINDEINDEIYKYNKTDEEIEQKIVEKSEKLEESEKEQNGQTEKNTLDELSTKHLNNIISVKYNCNELFERLRKLRENIAEYKIEFAVYQNNIEHLKADIARQNQINYGFFIKHNIPWPDPIPVPNTIL